MAKFLTTKGTSSCIEDIIRNAKDELVLVSPYLRLSEKFFQRLKEADRQNVKIYLIYGKNKLKPEEKRQLQQLKNLSLYFCKELHAKCYFNEETMVITSMNMYEYSENNNWEMGVLVSKKEDRDIFDDVVKEALSIKNIAAKDSPIRNVFSEVVKETRSIAESVIKDEPRRAKIGSYSHRTSARQKGHCIRCEKPIPLDLDKPLCRNCYEEWAEWENPNWVEHFCHTCGKSARTTIAMPQCNACYRKSQR